MSTTVYSQVLIHTAESTAVVLTLLDRTLVHRRYLPNNVGTHLQLTILGQFGGE